MSLRRPNLLRFTSHMAECIDFIESSPDALESDRLLCQWVRIQHIADDVGLQLSLDDPNTTLSMADPKVASALQTFERKMDEWRAQLPKSIDSCEPMLSFSAYACVGLTETS